MTRVIVWEVNMANVEVAYPISIYVPGINESAEMYRPKLLDDIVQS